MPHTNRTSGPAISRILRAEGWTPRPNRGEGIRVSGGRHYHGGYTTPVLVSCSWDDDEQSAEQSAQAEHALVGRGYTVFRLTPRMFHVEKS
jgi:hypothetical protein